MRLLIPSCLALAAALLCCPTAALAQAVVQPLPGTTDADRLGETMRRLASNPNDVSALIEAGELSLKVDDLSGAASLFARADKVDPRSARAKAGMASILVRAERPGEALRYFQQAETLGIAPERIAADRGLAYDLIGQQDRAQRDYRRALAAGQDDEVTRRYALSLGISGRKEQAVAALEPLLRRQDRGAWRARAFILAMNGDVPGASTIATTMMPSGMGQQLQPFFQRLAALGSVDRAFAVHFGEVRATPERVADARMAPVLAPLPPEPQAPVAVASVTPPPVRDERRSRRNGRAEREEQRRAAAAPVQVASSPIAQPGPAATRAAPAVGAAVGTAAGAQLAANSAPRQARPVTSAATGASVQARPYTQPTPPRVAAGGATSPTPGFGAGVTQSSAGVAYPPTPRVAANSAAAPVAPGFGAGATSPVARPTTVAPTTLPMRVADSATAPVTPSVGSGATGAAVARPPQTVVSAALPTTPARPVTVAPSAASVSAQPRLVAAAPVATPPATAPAQDSVLARIIANLSIPGSELGITGPARPVRVASADLADAKAKAAEDSADRREAVDRIADADDAPAPTSRVGRTEPAKIGRAGTGRARTGREVEAADAIPSPRTTGRQGAAAARGGELEAADATPAHRNASRRGTARPEEADDETASIGSRHKAAGDKDMADRKGAPARLTAAERKAAAAKKAQADKEAAEKKAARAEPERIWVQVATGANEGDLSKAYARVREKAPDQFKGRSGYTAPLRATNRVVTGPFKTQAEAQAFVNGLAKKGVSASTFTSDAGQKVSKLQGGK